jgi:hypothetical protein
MAQAGRYAAMWNGSTRSRGRGIVPSMAFATVTTRMGFVLPRSDAPRSTRIGAAQRITGTHADLEGQSIMQSVVAPAGRHICRSLLATTVGPQSLLRPPSPHSRLQTTRVPPHERSSLQIRGTRRQASRHRGAIALSCQRGQAKYGSPLQIR